MSSSSFEINSKEYFSLDLRVYSLKKLELLEKLIMFSRKPEDLNQLQYEINRLQIIRKRRELPNRYKVPFVKEIDKVINKFNNRLEEIGETSPYSVSPEIISIEQGMDVFSRESSAIHRRRILSKIDDLILSFEEWQKAFLEHKDKSKTLKIFFQKKLEDSACELEHFVYMYALSRGADKKGFWLEKIILSSKDNNFWERIDNFCRSNKYLIIEVSPDSLIQELQKLVKNYSNY